MGDAQSAQREGKKDAAAEEETGQVDEDARTEPHIEQKVSDFQQIQMCKKLYR